MELRKNSGPLKWTLIIISAVFLTVMLLLPLIYIVVTALRQGFAAYDFTGAFAASSILVILAVVILALRVWLERRGDKEADMLK